MEIGERLKELRIKRGFSQEDLAVRANFSKSYIQKFEEGNRDVKSSQLVQLATALNVSIPEFITGTNYSSDEFTLRNIEFRQEASINFDVNFFEKKILGDLHKKYDSYVKLEKILDSSIFFQNPLKNFEKIVDKKMVEDATILLRKKWKFDTTPIYDLISFLEDLGVKIFEVYEDESFAGFSCWEKNTPIIVINIKNIDVPRRRFTVLHELAHLLLKFEENEVKSNIERYCDYFAGGMLLPKDILLEYIEGKENITLQELKRIKSVYGISISAILVRIVNLEIITWKQYHEWKNLYNNWKEKDLTYEGSERVNRFHYLLAKGLSSKIFTKSLASQLSGMSIKSLSNNSFSQEFNLKG